MLLFNISYFILRGTFLPIHVTHEYFITDADMNVFISVNFSFKFAPFEAQFNCTLTMLGSSASASGITRLYNIRSSIQLYVDYVGQFCHCVGDHKIIQHSKLSSIVRGLCWAVLPLRRGSQDYTTFEAQFNCTWTMLGSSASASGITRLYNIRSSIQLYVDYVG